MTEGDLVNGIKPQTNGVAFIFFDQGFYLLRIIPLDFKHWSSHDFLSFREDNDNLCNL
ncbi:hypothetical protein ADIS_1800 [Lunatimonas lonarensis]|uniref:Uncharacterized protein n=1 Tax=Lunatimonas lonarensis TaxID=1232681 RepID=R7ZTW9_9BACT|nr:hypothetical protein ADIS_1800 [Lunatimonas lonarensis]